MILHEVYFHSLGDGGPLDGSLKSTIERDFGSVARWQSEFGAMGKALGGGSGWVLLTYSPRDRRLVNQWASDHAHAHALAGATPLLALDTRRDVRTRRNLERPLRISNRPVGPRPPLQEPISRYQRRSR